MAAHRRQRGLTQEALGTISGLSVDMISRMEAGTTGARFATIEKLARALECDAAELFTHRLPDGAMDRPRLTRIMTRLAKLDDDDLDWVENVLVAVLKHR